MSEYLAHAATGHRNDDTTRSARHWFVRAILKRRWMFIESVVATLVISLLGLGASFYSLQVYDRVIPTQAHATLLALTVGVGLAVLFEFILKQVRSWMVDRGCKAIEEELSDIFFGACLIFGWMPAPAPLAALQHRFVNSNWCAIS